MNSSSGSNDSGSAQDVATLTIVMTLLNGVAKINFVGPNVDTALNMLAQATRYMDARWRAEQIGALRAQVQEQEVNARIAQSLRKTV
jgi:hypothetical protein